MQDHNNQKSNHKYKDTLFRTLFGESKNFLELYNAVADENHPPDTPVTPYPSNELLARFNDIAACIGNRLIVFFEHQSTRSVNMPLRLLSYVTDILNLHIVDKDTLYELKQIKIPSPKFYVMYNGEQNFQANELKLSDAFIVNEKRPSLELIAKIVDINHGSGETALLRSSTLQGYSHLINEIRNNQRIGMTRDKAIATAVDSCIEDDILTDFLTEHYSEVSKMLNWEYDAEAEKRAIRREAQEETISDIARKLKEAGMTSTQILEITNLSESEIEQL